MDDFKPDDLANSNGKGEPFKLLVMQYLDGIHSEYDAKLLSEMLATSAENREIFAELSIQVGIINEMFVAVRNSNSSNKSAQDDSSASTALAVPYPANPNSSSAHIESSSDQNSLPGVFSITVFGSMTLLILVLSICLIAWKPWSNNVNVDEPNKTSIAQSSTALPAIKSIRLQSGSVNMTIDKVGWVIVEGVNGPAEFDLIAPMRAKLSRGRIRMRVTEKSGKGFVIETPGGDVTDLGTEFAIDVSDNKKSELVVLEGAVDLHLTEPQFTNASQQERFKVGEGTSFNESGEMQRVNSIIRGNKVLTFLHNDETARQKINPIISNVKDNLDTKKFYEIIPGGLNEDVSRCVDRTEAEWNGVTKDGMPKYLIGADYIKNFGDDVFQPTLQVDVTLDRPAKLYVFYDVRLTPPAWLTSQFRNTGDMIGSDAGHYRYSNGAYRNSKLGVGPGVSIDDKYMVWEQIVPKPCTVTLGPVIFKQKYKNRVPASIYGIAAVALEPKNQHVLKQE